MNCPISSDVRLILSPSPCSRVSFGTASLPRHNQSMSQRTADLYLVDVIDAADAIARSVRSLSSDEFIAQPEKRESGPLEPDDHRGGNDEAVGGDGTRNARSSLGTD